MWSFEDVSRGSAIFENRRMTRSGADGADPCSKAILKAEGPCFRSRVNIARRFFEEAPSASAILERK